MALTFKFDWRPLDGSGVTDRMEAATWAALKIVLTRDGRDELLTRSVDLRAQTVVDDVADSVLPLAEWLATNWPALAEVPSQQPKLEDALWQWNRQHNLRRVGSGSVLPDLSIWRLSSTTARLRWRADSAGADEFAPIEFLSNGEADLPLATIRDAISALVDGVVRRLEIVDGLQPRARRLADLWNGWQMRTDLAGARRLAAWRDEVWSDLSVEEAASLVALAAGPLAAHIEGLSLLPGTWTKIQNDAGEVWKACSTAGPASDEIGALRADLASSTRTGVGDPWHVGWRRAEAFRRTVGSEHADAESWITRSNLTMRQPLAGMERNESVVAWNAGKAPVSWSDLESVKQRSGRRFRAARDLYGVLYCGRGDAASCTYLGRSLHGFGSEARAFATELVAPVEQVAGMLANHRGDEDPVSSIAKYLEAPVGCVSHQIENHQLWDNVAGW